MPNAQQNIGHPFFLNLERMPVNIAGHTDLLIELVESIFKTTKNPDVKIFNENFPEKLGNFLKAHPQIQLVKRQILEDDINPNSLLIIDVDNYEYEESLIEMAKAQNALLSIVGKPHISDFSLSYLLNTENFRLGLSSTQHSAEIGHKISQVVENFIPADIGVLIKRLKMAQKDPLMPPINEELTELDRITAEYLQQKQQPKFTASEFENLSKIAKAVQRRANIYLGIIGVTLLIAIFSFILINFQLMPEISEFLNRDGYIFYKMLAVGFVAEIVAGSMGMGYGVICTTLLLLMNVAPPVVSASIHSAETFTSAAGSISHWRLKNVNKKLVRALAPAAVLGAIIGAFSLTYFGEHYAHIIKPVISCYTLYLGINILKNAFKDKNKEKKIRKQKSNSKLNVLGLAGGFIDSFAGGGWGPLVTGTLMKDGRTPRYVVGSSTLTKFILTLTSAITFVFTIGIQHWNIVLGLLLGGIITAPFSAMFTSRLPVKKMFLLIGVLVIVMSLISILKAFI